MIKLSIDYDGLHRPYCMYRKSKSPEAARYFGSRWYFLIHILFWEIVIWELA